MSNLVNFNKVKKELGLKFIERDIFFSLVECQKDEEGRRIVDLSEIDKDLILEKDFEIGLEEKTYTSTEAAASLGVSVEVFKGRAPAPAHKTRHNQYGNIIGLWSGKQLSEMKSKIPESEMTLEEKVINSIFKLSNEMKLPEYDRVKTKFYYYKRF